MAWTELYTGTETVSTTEHSLTTDTAGPDADTTAGVFMFLADVNAIAAADLFRFRIYEKARSGDTQRVIYDAYIGGPQATPNYITPAIPLKHGWDATLLKISGTDRAINWSVRQVA